ncbi:MAG: hypothetical protein R3C30_00330 [Hyphomonadaceae bacterium]
MTRYAVENASRQNYDAALFEFLQHYEYRGTEWRPGFGPTEFEGVWEGLRSRFWISRTEQNLLEAIAMYKSDLFGMFAPGVDLLDIGDDFRRRISSVEGVSIAQGF